MSGTERPRSPTSITKVLDLDSDELMLRVAIVLPGGVCLSTQRIIAKPMADALIVPVKFRTKHHILEHEQKRASYLKRREIIRLYSEEIAAQLAQALETRDNISSSLKG
jgi:hypothetical protein